MSVSDRVSEAGRPLADGATTVMLKKLDRRFTMEMLLDVLDKLINNSKYDFVYVPWDARRCSNIALAFINFVDHESAKFFYDNFNSPGLPYVGRMPRRCTAHVQGLGANLAYFVTCTGQREFKNPHAPQVYENGNRITLREAVCKYVTVEMLFQASELMDVKMLEKQNEGGQQPEGPGKQKAEDSSPPGRFGSRASAAESQWHRTDALVREAFRPQPQGRTNGNVWGQAGSAAVSSAPSHTSARPALPCYSQGASVQPEPYFSAGGAQAQGCGTGFALPPPGGASPFPESTFAMSGGQGPAAFQYSYHAQSASEGRSSARALAQMASPSLQGSHGHLPPCALDQMGRRPSFADDDMTCSSYSAHHQPMESSQMSQRLQSQWPRAPNYNNNYYTSQAGVDYQSSFNSLAGVDYQSSFNSLAGVDYHGVRVLGPNLVFDL
ncbi:unnamed protein product [Polarella glacialis]|uniref:Mei2-like C-terminal RNA recognition motif domain-containing protein n=1 Tax=Polarella glacialis TaxID=89957 RepID=A0A813DBX4_POLGL|nr:unnamed protein product [Polarella glacialis]CAE8672449.1 unnamed protein product [Polarella glacialis]